MVDFYTQEPLLSDFFSVFAAGKGDVSILNHHEQGKRPSYCHFLDPMDVSMQGIMTNPHILLLVLRTASQKKQGDSRTILALLF